MLQKILRQMQLPRLVSQQVHHNPFIYAAPPSSQLKDTVGAANDDCVREHDSGPLSFSSEQQSFNGSILNVAEAIEDHNMSQDPVQSPTTPVPLDLLWDLLAEDKGSTQSKRQRDKGSSRGPSPVPKISKQPVITLPIPAAPSIQVSYAASAFGAARPFATAPFAPSPLVQTVVDFTFQASMLPRINNAVATGGMCFWH